MSQATDRIEFYWIKRNRSDFLTPAYMLTEEDDDLIKAGVFKLSKEELHTMLCPFGCGETEDITAQIDDDGKLIHYVICSNGPDYMELEPKDYQLYAFDSSAFMRYAKGLSVVMKKKRQRKPRRPRSTEWIDVEREAVLDYANDPKRNTQKLEPYQVCSIVWKLNKEDFEAAAKLPKGQRGYSSWRTLRSYFYWNRNKKFGYESTLSISDKLAISES